MSLKKDWISLFFEGSLLLLRLTTVLLWSPWYNASSSNLRPTLSFLRLNLFYRIDSRIVKVNWESTRNKLALNNSKDEWKKTFKRSFFRLLLNLLTLHLIISNGGNSNLIKQVIIFRLRLLKKQFINFFPSEVNFTNILWAAFTCADPKSAKRQSS